MTAAELEVEGEDFERPEAIKESLIVTRRLVEETRMRAREDSGEWVLEPTVTRWPTHWSPIPPDRRERRLELLLPLLVRRER